MKYQDINYKYIDAEPMSEENMEQINQAVLNELGFNDLNLESQGLPELDEEDNIKDIARIEGVNIKENSDD